MYDWHNYGNDTIGDRSDVENVDIERLQAFYRLLLPAGQRDADRAGDFDPARTLAWIAAAFGKIPKPTRALPRLYTRRAGAGRRARDAGAARRRHAAAVRRLPRAGRLRIPTSRRSTLLGDAARPTRRPAACTSAWSRPSWRPASVRRSSALHDPGLFGFIAQLAPGQDGRAGARGADRHARGARPPSRSRPRSSRVPRPSGATAGTRPLPTPRAWAWRCRKRSRWATGASSSWAATAWPRSRSSRSTRSRPRYLLASNRTLATYVPTEAPQRAPAQPPLDLAAQFKGWTAQAGEAAVASFDPTPGQHRRPHPARRAARRAEAGAAAQADARQARCRRGWCCASATRRACSATARCRRCWRRCSTRAARRCRASRCRTGSTHCAPRCRSAAGRGR